MNDEFVRLMDEAQIIDPASGAIMHVKRENFQKFAELIVRECAQVCNDIDSEYEGEDVLATWCAKAIRDHFGVVE